MSKRLEVQQLIRDLRYQLWPGVSTWGVCACGEKTSRGGRRCSGCIEADIDAAIQNPGIASVLSQKMSDTMRLKEDIMDMAEDQNG